MAELVDALVSGASGSQAWGFESPFRTNSLQRFSLEICGEKTRVSVVKFLQPAAAMKLHAAMLLLFVPTVFAQTTTISMNPATPAPNETLTFTVRSTWPNGCVPRFQSVTGAGSNTIQINAVQTDCSGGCTQVVTPYTIETTPGTRVRLDRSTPW